jgi:hypothetical protein
MTSTLGERSAILLRANTPRDGHRRSGEESEDGEDQADHSDRKQHREVHDGADGESEQASEETHDRSQLHGTAHLGPLDTDIVEQTWVDLVI